MNLPEHNNTVTERVVPFNAFDGMPLNLINVRAKLDRRKPPVLLVHGAGVRANIFRAPVRETIVDTLVKEGYDVWLLNWRASIDLTPSRWTLDHAALYDHPAAVQKVLEETKADEVKAIIHCQGSTSFMMSLIAGLVPQISTVVSNAVSLHPVIPMLSAVKLKRATPIVKMLTDYLNPHWGVKSDGLFSKLLVGFVKATHKECDNTVCRMSSFTFGVGFPVMWTHENLNAETHQWLTEEFKHVPLTFFEQISKSVEIGHLIPAAGFSELPKDFVAEKPKTDARFAFFAGENNCCFLAESQKRSFDYFNKLTPYKHSLHIIPGYGHLDVFMGKNACRDVFPDMLNALEEPVISAMASNDR